MITSLGILLSYSSSSFFFSSSSLSSGVSKGKEGSNAVFIRLNLWNISGPWPAIKRSHSYMTQLRGMPQNQPWYINSVTAVHNQAEKAEERGELGTWDGWSRRNGSKEMAPSIVGTGAKNREEQHRFRVAKKILETQMPFDERVLLTRLVAQLWLFGWFVIPGGNTDVVALCHKRLSHSYNLLGCPFGQTKNSRY